jgi:hypothetical protein
MKYDFIMYEEQKIKNLELKLSLAFVVFSAFIAILVV